MTNPIPKFWKESSLLSIEKLVKWKKKMKPYNFSSLPTTVIIDGFGNKNSFWSRFFLKKLKGIKGDHYISKNGKYLLSSNIGNGAPEMILVCEELRCLGVAEFIFIGLAGSLNETISEGDAFFVQKAFSGVGVTSYYSSKNEFECVSSRVLSHTITELNLKPANCFSTDAPYRETASLIQVLRDKNVDLIEMECAALFAFSEFYSLNSLSILVAADALSSGWSPPKDYTSLVSTKDKLIKIILSSQE